MLPFCLGLANMCEYQQANPSDFFVYSDHVSSRRDPRPAGTAQAPRTKRAIITPRLIPLLLLWLSGACLRLTVLATPPVIPLLHADLHLTETQIGWLSSL